jgi:DNA polymerase/3'-5' exonuclease PolX
MCGNGKRWELGQALMIGQEIKWHMEMACTRIEIVGSVRRAKPDVGDIELMYIGRSKEMPVQGDMFASAETNLADLAIENMISHGVLEKRVNAVGRTAYGPQIKLMRHVKSGLPVDLFAATDLNWWNYLVCRTGPAESNTRIACEARARGWKWTPYGAGFESLDGARSRAVASEREVFEFVGLPYLNPKDRTMVGDATGKEMAV